MPLMMQKSDGGCVHDSADAEALKYRVHELNTKRIMHASLTCRNVITAK